MMKKSLVLAFASIIILCGSATLSSAQTARNHRLNINQRQQNQQKRIGQGINSGELTPREAARLERQEVKINREEKRYRQSGDGLSPRERADLNRDLNRESHSIYNQKHDDNTPQTPNINGRQANQNERIENGVQNGSLTPQETQRLTRQEARISDLEAKDRASGGKLSAKERAELNGLLDLESHNIYRQKHDQQGTRP